MTDVKISETKKPIPWTHFEDNREIVEQIKRVERKGNKVTISGVVAAGTATSDNKLRVGVGGEVIFPVRPGGRVNLGVRYLHSPFKHEKIWGGHRFEVFADLPKLVPWGRVQGGLYSDVASLTSFEDFKKEMYYGFFGGVAYDIWRPTSSLTLALDAKAGIGFGWPKIQQTIFRGGLVFGGDIDF